MPWAQTGPGRKRAGPRPNGPWALAAQGCCSASMLDPSSCGMLDSYAVVLAASLVLGVARSFQIGEQRASISAQLVNVDRQLGNPKNGVRVHAHKGGILSRFHLLYISETKQFTSKCVRSKQFL